MKNFIIALSILTVLIVGCGQETSTPSHPSVDISMTSIVWQGYANEDPILLQKFNDTMECLGALNVPMIEYPYVVVVSDPFICASGLPASGCAVMGENKIYLHLILAFPHEVIHLATGLGMEAESSIYFLQCQNPQSNNDRRDR